jgi:hypothetical protein
MEAKKGRSFEEMVSALHEVFASDAVDIDEVEGILNS